MSTYILRNSDADVRVRGRVGGVRSGEANGKVVRNISVAFQRSWPKQDQPGEFDHRTQWVEVACWEKAAEYAKNVEKGDVVEVSFSMADLQTSTYTKDGQTMASLKIARGQVLLLAKKAEGNGEPADQPVTEEQI